MVKLNQKTTTLNLPTFIILKLKKLNFTKLGHIFMSSYQELFYTHLFTSNELNEIQACLNNQGLDFINEMNLSKIPYLKRDIIRFNFGEYQQLLCSAHLKEYDETEIEPLMYSDSLFVIKYLFPIYRQIYLEDTNKFQKDKVAINNYLNNHPSMTIADFVDITPHSSNINIVQIISTILDLSLNCEMSYSEMIDRENKIFNCESVDTDTIKTYEYIARLNDEDMDKYLKGKSKGKQYIKKLTN